MGARMVRIDCSADSNVAVCDPCHWRGVPQLDVMAARRDADNHRRREHPEQARDTLKKRRRRAR